MHAERPERIGCNHECQPPFLQKRILHLHADDGTAERDVSGLAAYNSDIGRRRPLPRMLLVIVDAR
eukprot:6206973-Pleurochrysis_carterae.AAC.1